MRPNNNQYHNAAPPQTKQETIERLISQQDWKNVSVVAGLYTLSDKDANTASNNWNRMLAMAREEQRNTLPSSYQLEQTRQQKQKQEEVKLRSLEEGKLRDVNDGKNDDDNKDMVNIDL